MNTIIGGTLIVGGLIAFPWGIIAVLLGGLALRYDREFPNEHERERIDYAVFAVLYFVIVACVAALIWLARGVTP